METDIFQSIAEGTFSKQQRENATFYDPKGPVPSNIFRIVIVEVINDPLIITDEKASYYRHVLNVSNIKYVKVLPRNTIIGRKLLVDSNESEQSMFFFPFLPSHLSLPCKPGEHVWAFFEAPQTKNVDIGWWMWRAVTFDHTDDVNHSHAPRDLDSEFFVADSSKTLAQGGKEVKYDFLNGQGESDDSGTRYIKADTRCISGTADEYEKILLESNASKLIEYECVPRYKKRPDELVWEGSNNQLIVFGTDRCSSAYQQEKFDEEQGIIPKKSIEDISGANTGKIDMVVGRGQTIETSGKSIKNSLGRNELAKDSSQLIQHEGDIDYKNDRSRLLIAQKTLVDSNFNLDIFNETYLSDIVDKGVENTTKESKTTGDSAAVLKSDKVRIIARSDVIFYVTSYDRNDVGNMVDSDDISKWAAFAIKQNGDIVIKPSENGAILLGGEDASHGIFVSDTPCTLDRTSGKVTGVGPISTAGGQLVTGVPGQGQWGSRILVKV